MRNDFFASVFTTEDVGEISTLDLLFSVNKDEVLSETEMSEEVMDEFKSS